ncbi:recombinase family protein [Gordonia sp. PDNC005]|uniref:recombinase family protein n=1 Tax=Gordonia sp. PDNC005 TaxID=2811424 RepID=UPI001963383B|nr:recombinase family protein [Gordonia sp. PDNC005]QRY62772.1 recombinase family protein [Gordonia sp. PDNC005]
MSRAYGWTADGSVDSVEADELRDMAEWIVGGGSGKSLVARLNADGVRTVSGKPWSAPVIKRALTNPRIAGKQVTKDGALVDNPNVEPILDERLWKRVCDRYADPDRQQFVSRRANSEPWLLSGMVRCGHCGGPMYPHWNGNYKTVSARCGQVVIQQKPMLREVVEQVLARVTSPMWLDALAAAEDNGADHYRAVIDMSEERTAAIMVDYGAGRIDKSVADSAVAAAAKVKAEAEQKIAEIGFATGLPARPTADDVIAWWEAARERDRRALVQVVVDSVTVTKPEDADSLPDRVRITWK